MNKKTIILIIVAIIIAVALISYAIFYYKIKTLPAQTGLNPTIISQEVRNNYTPPNISDVVDLSGYQVDSYILSLSNGNKQYVSTFQTNNLTQTFQDLESQISKAGYSVSENQNYYLGAHNGNISLQIFVPGINASTTMADLVNSSSTVIIVLNGEK